MALPKVYRLRKRQDFSAVYQLGIKRSAPHLILRALRPEKQIYAAQLADSQNQLKPAQVGISISQKVSKRAVIRNRIKRQIRAALRQFLPYLRPGWQIVIIVKPNAVQCDYEEFLRELKQLLVKAEVLNGY
ncbi:MAG: hypothetical protein Kow00121_18800 [Elainellaceae cyanobacterium]